jgi:hypothetical protein
MTNVQPISVNGGAKGNYVNGPFTSVTICVPGTANCQAINNILVDTGSYGLRVFASALGLALPQQTNAIGNPIGECALFVDSFTWGPVGIADVILAGEKASAVAMQVIGAAGFPPPPFGCLSSGLPPNDKFSSAGANGFLGIGVFAHDCGGACAISGPANPGFYYSCPVSGCVVTAESLNAQVENPVASFPSDNNGVVVDLPAIGANGAPTVNGSLVFGIGTRPNNSPGNAQAFTTDDAGNISTVFGGTAYPSFFDSGSNGIFFLSPAITGLARCLDGDSAFYCPPNTVNLAAQNRGHNGVAGPIAFSIANAQNLFATENIAFNDLGGPNPGIIDFGVPVFYGREVFVAIQNASTPLGPGPYYAY